jgi:hypothetical protein
MRILSVSWNPNSDETKLKFTEEFLTSDWTVRADVLKDILVEIDDLYNATVAEEYPAMADLFGHGKGTPMLESVK